MNFSGGDQQSNSYAMNCHSEVEQIKCFADEMIALNTKNIGAEQETSQTCFAANGREKFGNKKDGVELTELCTE